VPAGHATCGATAVDLSACAELWNSFGSCGALQPARFKKDGPAMKLRQSLLSAGVFALVLGVLVIFDERVRIRLTELLAGGDGGITPWGDRLGDLGGALVSALKYQSIENAPLLIFVTIGAMLFLFMVKT
jgi:hypothetical protein